MPGLDLRLKSLSVAVAGRTVLHPIDLDVAAGECVAVLGPAGAGKTTLLRCIAGFLAPTLGRVLVGGSDVTDLPPERRPTTIVFAEPALFTRMSLADNVAFGLEARGIAPARRRARAAELLAQVGLTGLGARRPADLSLADRRRAALARALAVDPPVILLDEPFAGLDVGERRRLGADLAEIRRTAGLTLLAATVDQDAALALADRVAVLNAGRIDQIDAPDRLWSDPATRFVAGWLGTRNVFPGRIAAVGDDLVEVETAVGRLKARGGRPFAPGDPVELMVRPEQVMVESHRAELGLAPADPATWNRLTADLVGRTLEGASLTYDFDVAGTRLSLSRPNLGPHDLLLANLHAIGFSAEDAVVFPAPPAAGAGDG